MSLQELTRISVMVSRRRDISEEEFHRYWANNHGPLVQEMLVQYGIVKYTQYHITPEYKAKGQAIGGATPYDGVAEFFVHRYEDMTNFFADPRYMEIIRPDEEKFVDVSKIVFNVGVDYVVVDNNTPIHHNGESAF